jgi:hypothetical protein
MHLLGISTLKGIRRPRRRRTPERRQGEEAGKKVK